MSAENAAVLSGSAQVFCPPPVWREARSERCRSTHVHQTSGCETWNGRTPLSLRCEPARHHPRDAHVAVLITWPRCGLRSKCCRLFFLRFFAIPGATAARSDGNPFDRWSGHFPSCLTREMKPEFQCQVCFLEAKNVPPTPLSPRSALLGRLSFHHGVALRICTRVTFASALPRACGRVLRK